MILTSNGGAERIKMHKNSLFGQVYVDMQSTTNNLSQCSLFVKTE